MKRFCGDDSQTLRKPHEHEITARLTATMLLFCNPGSVPYLRLQDEAMADRLRVLPYPGIPEESRDPLFTRRVQTDETFKEAFLARLIAAAAAERPGVPPEEPPEVAAATAERVRDDVGELGTFVRRLVRDADNVLAFSEVWAAWCEYNEENPDEAHEPGGISKRRLSGALREFVPSLPAARQFRIGKGRARGWRGWRLLSTEEAEQAAVDQLAEKSPVIQAMQDLLAGFPDDFSVLGHTIGNVTEILQTLDNAELLALRTVCDDGRALAKQVRSLTERSFHMNIATGTVFDADGNLRDCRPALDKEVRVQEQLRKSIFHLAWEAIYDQSGKPVLKDLLRMQDVWAWWTRRTAMSVVEAAVQKVGPEADVPTVLRKAISLLWDEIDSIPEEEREKYNLYDTEDIATAIKYLINFERAPSIHQRVTAERLEVEP